MQTSKDDTRRLLLKTARAAFLQKGYKSVSMREISKLSGVGLSNIYNYYPSKDDLLAAVLQPLFEAMDDMLYNHNRDENFSLEIFASEKIYRKNLQEQFGVITRYRKELKLLFLDTQDSRFKDYWEQWVEKWTTVGMEYMERMNELYPNLHTHISPLFIRFTAWVWLNMIKTVVLNEELSQESFECFIGEYIHFSTGGWKKLMNVERSNSAMKNNRA